MLFYKSAPTFWEAAADAILMKKTIKGMDPAEFGQERIFYSYKEKADLDNNGKTIQANDIVVENTDN
ncbi:hypothetical protein HUJ04_008530 [Dendroctonus ponderosae]|nr:hypothetical protein HUJ04_008530 [Dendroctonus ponderosae]